MSSHTRLYTSIQSHTHTHFPLLPLVIISKLTHMHFLAFVAVYRDRSRGSSRIIFAGNEGAYYFP